MRLSYASQYGTACVVIEDGDRASDVIDCAVMNEATYLEDEEECVVADFQRGVGPEIYTKEALRRSIR